MFIQRRGQLQGSPGFQTMKDDVSVKDNDEVVVNKLLLPQEHLKQEHHDVQLFVNTW